MCSRYKLLPVENFLDKTSLEYRGLGTTLANKDRSRYLKRVVLIYQHKTLNCSRDAMQPLGRSHSLREGVVQQSHNYHIGMAAESARFVLIILCR